MPDWFNNSGFMIYPLLACSVLMITICLERTVFFTFTYLKKEEKQNFFQSELFKHRDLKKERRDELLSIMLNETQDSYYNGLKTLRIIGTITPMLGLLGTILGIIISFKTIANHTGAISPNLIAEGLWQAMLTTAIGMIIALPSLLFSHIFKSIAENMLKNYSLKLNRLSLSLEQKENDKNSNIARLAA